MKKHKRFSFALTKLPSSTSDVFVHNSLFFSELFLAVAQVIPQENNHHSFSLKLRQPYDRQTHTHTELRTPSFPGLGTHTNPTTF